MTDNINALTQWAFIPNDHYHAGYSIACEGDDGSICWDDLDRGASYAIVLKAKAIGSSHIVLCGGIRHLADAKAIVSALQSREEA